MKNKFTKQISLSQVFLLVIGIFAIASSISFSSNLVSAEETPRNGLVSKPVANPVDKETIKALTQMNAQEIENWQKATEHKYSQEIEVLKNKGKWGWSAGFGTLSMGAGIISSFKAVGPYGLTKVLSIVGGSGVGGTALSIAGGFVIAGLVSYGIALMFEAFGASNRNMQNLYRRGALFGTLAGGTTVGILTAAGAAGPIGWAAVIVAAGVTLTWTAFTWKNYSRELFDYTVSLWQPPTGGDNCGACHDLEYGCSQYQCHTFGSTCKLINPDTDDAQCISVSTGGNGEGDGNGEDGGIDCGDGTCDMGETYNSCPDDCKEGCGDGTCTDKEDFEGDCPEDCGEDEDDEDETGGDNDDYTYDYDEVDNIFEISDNGECLPEQAQSTLTIRVSQDAQCYYGEEDLANINESPFDTGSVYKRTHQIQLVQLISLAKKDHSDQTFYFNCLDRDGNKIYEESMRIIFCVKKIDDEPPTIISTNPANGDYLLAGITQTGLVANTDEPAKCKWDTTNKRYSNMANEMNCAQPGDTNPVTCTTTLTGLEKGINRFYLRCVDKPWVNYSNYTEAQRYGERNEMITSYVLELYGTEPLVINEILVDNKVGYSTAREAEELYYKNSSTNVPQVEFVVKTLRGASERGEAICTYKAPGSSEYRRFSNNNQQGYVMPNTHTTSLRQIGENIFKIKCVDEAGNSEEKEIPITFEVDDTAPEVARVYYESNSMKLITTEQSECSYSLFSCDFSFEEGQDFYTYDGIEHSADWDTESDMYIRCKDEYENAPPLEQCQIVARAADY